MDTSVSGLTIKRVALDTLHADPANARAHGERNLEAIAASLKQFAQVEPLVVQRSSGKVIGGNGRLAAMKSLGWTEADIVEVDMSDVQATALGIALNRTAELAEWDSSALSQLLESLSVEDALDGVGFEQAHIDELLRQVIADNTPQSLVEDVGPGEPPVVAVSRRGDVWLLDDHRLLCGDTTSAVDVATLMAGDAARLCATDPPYLVDYVGDRPNDAGKDWSGVYREIDITDPEAFFRAMFTNILSVLGPRGAIYAWHTYKRTGLIQRIWEELGILDHQEIIWRKPSAVFGRVFWHFQHESCSMGWRQGDQPVQDGDHEFSSVWEIDYDGKGRVVGNEHPTQKPVEIFARPMRKHTVAGDVVFEPFSGSGSQLIAAEQLGRRCRAMEISEPFVDVAVVRWQRATGKSAVLESSGQSFADVAAERSGS